MAPRFPFAATRVFIRGGLLALAAIACGGCSHQHAWLSLDAARRDGVKADLGVAGVLDRRGETPCISKEATSRLVQASGAKDVSAAFSPSALQFLMAPPSELLIYSEMLTNIRELVGRRYLLAGQQGTASVDRNFYWCPCVLVPFPYMTIGSRTELLVSEESEATHAAQVLRVIDLEEAAIIAEYHMVLSDPPQDASAWRGDLRGALAAMALK